MSRLIGRGNRRGVVVLEDVNLAAHCRPIVNASAEETNTNITQTMKLKRENIQTKWKTFDVTTAGA